MEDLDNKTTEDSATKQKDIFLAVIITEAVCVTIILLGILFMKYFSENGFKGAKEFYSEYFLTETTVSEVITG